jgi:hypothetical protein
MFLGSFNIRIYRLSAFMWLAHYSVDNLDKTVIEKKNTANDPIVIIRRVDSALSALSIGHVYN